MDSAGNHQEHYRYDAFGKPAMYNNAGVLITTSGVGLEPVFGGMRWLSTNSVNLYLNHGRLMDPEHGLFLGTDALGYIDSPNLYAYVKHNPISLIDPFGLSATKSTSEEDKLPAVLGKEVVVTAERETGTTVTAPPKFGVDTLLLSTPSTPVESVQKSSPVITKARTTPKKKGIGVSVRGRVVGSNLKDTLSITGIGAKNQTKVSDFDRRLQIWRNWAPQGDPELKISTPEITLRNISREFERRESQYQAGWLEKTIGLVPRLTDLAPSSSNREIRRRKKGIPQKTKEKIYDGDRSPADDPFGDEKFKENVDNTAGVDVYELGDRDMKEALDGIFYVVRSVGYSNLPPNLRWLYDNVWLNRARWHGMRP